MIELANEHQLQNQDSQDEEAQKLSRDVQAAVESLRPMGLGSQGGGEAALLAFFLVQHVIHNEQLTPAFAYQKAAVKYRHLFPSVTPPEIRLLKARCSGLRACCS